MGTGRPRHRKASSTRYTFSVRRWIVALVLVLLSCVPLFVSRSSGPELLRDSDTAVLLDAIRERHSPLSWFLGDWPLKNHFYRPVSTLSFEIDNALYGTQSAGYGQTQALLCILCVLALFWLVRELTDQPIIASTSAILFTLWHIHATGWLTACLRMAAWASLFAYLLPKRKLWPPLIGFLVFWLAADVSIPLSDIGSGVMAWLPGRTASVMTLFALIALAGYVRFERLTAQRFPAPEPIPLDPPATKGTLLQGAPARHPWVWLVISSAGLMAALGSYEQAVMLPVCFLISAVTLRSMRYRVRWIWQAVAWGILFGYLALRSALVPSEVSGYQAQQFRSGPDVWTSFGEYLFPSIRAFYAGLRTLSADVFDTGGVFGLLWVLPYAAFTGMAATAVSLWKSKQEPLIYAVFAMSFFAFLPMAWLKSFHHYHYWPMAFRAVLTVLLVVLAGKTLATAMSLPKMQAPQRPDPAPGSLPHP